MALALGGRTVEEWQTIMPHMEFVRWMDFYAMHPFDDLHRFHRPAALLAAVKGYSMETAIDYLHPPNRVDNIDEVGLSVMRALGIKRR